MKRAKVLWVRDPVQWRVVLSPVRSEILQALRCLGPSSVGELGEMVDRPADTLYRHLEILERAGFVRSCGLRVRGRHRERLYDNVAEDFALDLESLRDAAARRTLSDTAKVFSATAARAISDAAAAGELIAPTEHRNFVVNYELTRLTPKDFKRARELSFQLKQLLDRARAKRAGRLYAAVVILSPVVRKQRPSLARKVRARESQQPAS